MQAEVERLVGPRATRSPRARGGGVEVTADLEAMMRLNLESGLASQVLVRVAELEARHLSALARKAARVPWRDILGAARWEVFATCRRSRLYHTGAVAQRVDEAIASALGRKGSDDGGDGGGDDSDDGAPRVAVRVRIERDQCTLSIDTSGEPLHRRGWRLAPGAAPLREDLAHALLVVSRWSPATPLIDPMAGVGTIPIEAAAIARGLAPGRLRSFAFEDTALHDPSRWASLRDEVLAGARAQAPALIIARDRDESRLHDARHNAKRAGVEDDIRFEVAALEDGPLRSDDLQATDGAVVTHPPYGRRLRDAASTRRALATRLAELPDPWHVGLAVPPGTAGLGAGLQPALLTDHGGTKIELVVR